MAIDKTVDFVARKTWKLIRKNWKWYVEISFFSTLILGFLIVVSAVLALFLWNQSPILSISVGFLLFFISFGFSSIFASIAGMESVTIKPRFEDIFIDSFRRIIPITVYTIGFIVFGILSIIFLFIPLIALSPQLSIAFYLILEGRPLSDALKESFSLVKGRWLESFVVIFIINAVTSLGYGTSRSFIPSGYLGYVVVAATLFISVSFIMFLTVVRAVAMKVLIDLYRKG